MRASAGRALPALTQSHRARPVRGPGGSRPVRPAHPPSPAGARHPTRSFADTFALLAECLLVGVYVLVASLPVVTVPAALAAGTAHLRRHLAGQGTEIGRFVRDWWAAVRDLWVLGAAGLALAGTLALNVQVAASGLLPGGPAVRWLSLAVGVASAVVVVRVAGAWSMPDDDRGRAPAASVPGVPGARSRAAGPTAWPDDDRGRAPAQGDGPAHHLRRARALVLLAARSTGADPAGSLLLVVAIGLCGVLVWMLTPLVAVVGGLLCLAVIAVESRALS
ncbi:hypothetical protein GCM10027059_42960 [Myceligenerans halotolerans]